MDVLINLVPPLFAGAAIGAVYFGGLWYTLSRMRGTRHPAALLLGSYLLRGSLVLAGLMLIARLGGLRPLLACVIGIIAARMLLVRRWGPRWKSRPKAERLDGSPWS